MHVEGLVGSEGFAVDASLIRADANRQRCVPGEEGLPAGAASRTIGGSVGGAGRRRLRRRDVGHAEAHLAGRRGVALDRPVSNKSVREDGTFSRADFAYDHEQDIYRCPGGAILQRNRRAFSVPRTKPRRTIPTDTGPARQTSTPVRSRACCPNTPTRKGEPLDVRRCQGLRPRYR